MPYKDIAPDPHIQLILLAPVLPLLSHQARQIPVIRDELLRWGQSCLREELGTATP